VIDVESVRLRWTGHRIRAEAGITVDPSLSVTEGHAIAIDAHHHLLHDVPKLVQANVHVSPSGEVGAAQHATLTHHQPTATARATESQS
jgi:divalent metal cation (Fe/Co/Zn/Cd) transporter